VAWLRYFETEGSFAVTKRAATQAEAPRPAASLVAELGARIARIENRAPSLEAAREGEAGPCLTLGIDEIDAMLCGRLAASPVPAAALHEVRAQTGLDAAAATAFALALGTRALECSRQGVEGAGTMFWIAGKETRGEAGLLYGPGLAALGLGGELIRVFVDNTADALWAAGEVAAHKGAGLCLLEMRGNPAKADLAFSRRLALRARESGVPVIVLRQGGDEEASAALTRWRVAPAPSALPDLGALGGQGPARKWLGPPAFAVALEKCRGGQPGEWIMEWKSDERLFAPFKSGSGTMRSPAAAFMPNPSGPGSRPTPDKTLSLHNPHRAADGQAGKAAPRPGMAARRAS
jgi:protein ImuA